MCGIFGWVLRNPPNRSVRNQTSVIASILSVTNDKRGGDSWGIFAHNTLVKGLHRITTSHTLLGMSTSQVMIAHTRKATTGTVSVENAHPFKVGNIVGAHNGMVSNHHLLNKDNGRNCQVDSEHIFHHIKEGKPLQEIEAYGAIEYVLDDLPEEGAFVGKFNFGELSIAQTSIGVVWSSERSDLKKALQFGGIPYRFYNIQDNTLYQAYNNKLYRIDSLKFEEPWIARNWNNPAYTNYKTPNTCWDFH